MLEMVFREQRYDNISLARPTAKTVDKNTPKKLIYIISKAFLFILKQGTLLGFLPSETI